MPYLKKKSFYFLKLNVLFEISGKITSLSTFSPLSPPNGNLLSKVYTLVGCQVHSAQSSLRVLISSSFPLLFVEIPSLGVGAWWSLCVDICAHKAFIAVHLKRFRV